MGQNKSYHNNWSPHINHKRTIIKFTNDKWYSPKQILSQILIITHQPQKDYCQIHLWIMIWAKTDLITIIDHQTSNTEWLLSNLLMINDMGQNRSYPNNWSPYVNHKRNMFVKFKCKNCASKKQMAKKQELT